MVEISFVLIGIALFGTIVGTYTDVRTRLVPDWTNYFMLVSGLGAYAIISVLQNTFLPILYSVVGLAAFFGLGYVLYKSGAWGGGDAKMLAAYGAIFAPFPAIAAWPFIISLWLNIVLFGAVFGILGMFFIFIKNREKIAPELGKTLSGNRFVVYALSGAGLVSAVLTAYEIAFVIILALVLLAFLALIFKPTEKVCLHKKIKPSQLVEGDWITHDIKVGSFAYEPKKSGIEKKDIEKLIQLEKSGKLDYVEVKDGLPYVPAFLAALIVALAYGDILYQMMAKFMGV